MPLLAALHHLSITPSLPTLRNAKFLEETVDQKPKTQNQNANPEKPGRFLLEYLHRGQMRPPMAPCLSAWQGGQSRESPSYCLFGFCVGCHNLPQLSQSFWPTRCGRFWRHRQPLKQMPVRGRYRHRPSPVYPPAAISNGPSLWEKEAVAGSQRGSPRREKAGR
jgi:hypothetical protein